MSPRDLASLGAAISCAQATSAAVAGHRQLLAYLGDPRRLSAALGRLENLASAQRGRWARVASLCRELRKDALAETISVSSQDPCVR